jgi:hypothetical protein
MLNAPGLEAGVAQDGRIAEYICTCCIVRIEKTIARQAILQELKKATVLRSG